MLSLSKHLIYELTPFKLGQCERGDKDFLFRYVNLACSFENVYEYFIYKHLRKIYAISARGGITKYVNISVLVIRNDWYVYLYILNIKISNRNN